MVLALDVGTAVIGLARTDPSRRIVFAEGTLVRRSVAKDAEALAAVCARHGVTQLVVGLPLTPDGGEARMAKLARQVGDALGARTGLPVAFVDERYSSAEARLRAIEAGRPSRKVDPEAAMVILEDWLEEHPG